MHIKIAVQQRIFWIILAGGLVFGIGVFSFFEKKNDSAKVQTGKNIQSALDQGERMIRALIRTITSEPHYLRRGMG